LTFELSFQISIAHISIWTSAWAFLSLTNSYPENCLWHFTKIVKFLSGQTYGISKNFANFYLDLDQASEGTFRGPFVSFVGNLLPK